MLAISTTLAAAAAYLLLGQPGHTTPAKPVALQRRHALSAP